MNILQKLGLVTQELLEILENEQQENREYVIEQITNKLLERDNLLAELNRPFNDQEKLIVEQIMLKDRIISEKMALIFQDVKNDIIVLKKQKSSNIGYNNPYEKSSFDGMFFDKKK